jgi:hypothetical protein
MLKHAGWPEQFDCALCSSKGFATRAVRTLLRLLKESPELTVVFVIHDADGPGTVIYATLRDALKPFGVDVVNLGLDPAEARAMGLAEEPVKRKKGNRVPVADYIPDDDKEWLQANRIELNAMATPQFVEWLTAKVEAYFRRVGLSPKVIPPAGVLGELLKRETRTALERRIVDEVLKAADIPGRVEAAFAEVKLQINEATGTLTSSLPDRLKTDPKAHWTDMVKTEAAGIASPGGGKIRPEMQTPKQAADSQIEGSLPDSGRRAETKDR